MMNTIKHTFLLGCVIFLLSGCAGNEKIETPVSKIEYKTDTVEVNGHYFTYRKTGTNAKTDVPLILFMHTRGNLDSWDGALLEKLGSERIVITFNNRGVASSGGQTPESFALMAEDAYHFIKALGYSKVDVLGFSIGGCVAQELLFSHKEIVRNGILAGTSPKGARSINQRDPKIVEMLTKPNSEQEVLLALFFNASDKSRELGEASLQRRSESKYPRDAVVSKEAAEAQAIARFDWGNGKLDATHYENITNPILVATGKADVQMPAHNSVELYNLLPNAQLNLYPDSGHGFLFQYPEIFGSDVNRFLNSNNR